MDLETSVILIGMKACIVAVSLILTYAEIRQAIRLKGSGYAWIKWALGILGIYWAFYYTQSLVIPGGILNGHQIYVRSPLLLTLAFVAAGAIFSLRRGNK